MDIRFLLNGETVELAVTDPTVTLLDWLREVRKLTGTKEGCNEGDCGACSVIVTDSDGAKPLNACILFLPQINGKAVRTVEGIAAPDGALHPVQEAMVTEHGSQCGFCTPGFITTMAANHLNGVYQPRLRHQFHRLDTDIFQRAQRINQRAVDDIKRCLRTVRARR